MRGQPHTTVSSTAKIDSTTNMYSSAPFALLDSFTFFFCINHNLFSVDWVIVAIGKEILIPVGFVGGRSYHGGGIRVDKPSPNRVIVPAAEVVQARLAVVDIPTIAQGIRSAEGGGHGAAGIHKTGNVALGVSARIQMSTL